MLLSKFKDDRKHIASLNGKCALANDCMWLYVKQYYFQVSPNMETKWNQEHQISFMKEMGMELH